MPDTTLAQRFAVTPLHPLFAAEVTGLDLRQPLDDATFRAVRDAFDAHSVLVFRDQRLDTPQQIAFSERFGELEVMQKGAVGSGQRWAGITNVDPETNEIIAADDPRMLRQYGNELWHTDSSFKRVSAIASLLHGREVPPTGGDTSFACMRAAFAALDAAEQERLRGLQAEHSFVYSRSLVVKDDFLTAEQKAEVPPVPQTMVTRNPRTGDEALYIASHASRVLDMDEAEGRALLDRLMAHATQPEFVYRHAWQPWDLVMWDNRATMHCGSEYDYRHHRRVMVRTTVGGSETTMEERARG